MVRNVKNSNNGYCQYLLTQPNILLQKLPVIRYVYNVVVQVFFASDYSNESETKENKICINWAELSHNISVKTRLVPSRLHRFKFLASNCPPRFLKDRRLETSQHKSRNNSLLSRYIIVLCVVSSPPLLTPVAQTKEMLSSFRWDNIPR